MEQIRGALATKLQGIERYNPENITLLESYVDAQVRENGYDLEANLALLKLYQFNSGLFNANAVFMIMVRIKFIRSCDILQPLGRSYDMKKMLLNFPGQGFDKSPTH